MIARDGQVAAALAEAGARADADDLEAAWCCALAWQTAVDSYQRTALCYLATELLRGNLAGARAAARWIVDPAGAMDAAVAESREVAL